MGSGVTLTLGANVTLQGRSDNTAPLVKVNGGTLAMNAGSKISGNYGNGVYVEYSTFAMKGGAVSGNSASSSSYDGGGGVYVGGGSTFTRQWRGGTIYGSDANSALKNTATDGDAYGHAVYVETSPARVRNTTAGSSIDMDSAQAGSTGGWE